MYSESHFARFLGFLKKLLYIVHLQLYGLRTIQVLLLKVCDFNLTNSVFPFGFCDETRGWLFLNW